MGGGGGGGGGRLTAENFRENPAAPYIARFPGISPSRVYVCVRVCVFIYTHI